MLTRTLSLALSLCLLLPVEAMAASSDVLTADVRLTVNAQEVDPMLPLPGAERKVTMALHGVPCAAASRAM